MLSAYLLNLKDLLEESCPYEVRLAHSGRRMPESVPFVVLGVKSAAADLSAAVCGGSIRYPLTAVITASVYVPLDCSSDEAARILAAYVLPVMAGGKAQIQGISEGGLRDDRTAGCHILTAEFRVRGVYTIESEGDV